jgi:hypothetical protein
MFLVLAVIAPAQGQIRSGPSFAPAVPRSQLPPAPTTPYPMNYTDEAAATLGIKSGHLDVFSAQPTSNDGLLPNVSGGVDHDGAMLKLQWHPGE